MANTAHPYQNKTTIRKRMRGFAARHFGISQSEILDPVVNLLLESLSEEVYKIAGAIEDTENRIRDKLTHILTPGMETIAQPAHAILHAQASEGVVTLTTQTEFQCVHATNRLSFYPACNTRICNGSIRYVIHNESIYAVNNDQTYTQITRSGKNDLSRDNTFWIGLELDDRVDYLVNLSFYIDFQGVNNPEKYLNLLSYAQWKIQDRELRMIPGLHATEDEIENDTLKFFSVQDLGYKINRKIKKEYDVHFFTVENDTPVDQRETFPEKLKAYFPGHVQERLTQPLVWIEVRCPAALTPDILDSMRISLNAFPVINRQLINKTVEINKFAPVIPLNTGNNESFIAVCSLTDSKGRQYYDVPVRNTDTTQYGIYALSRGGYERYSRREAIEFLSAMVDAISGEASFFFKNENDVNAGLKKINEEAKLLVKQLDRILSETRENYEVENYILIEPESKDEMYFLSYWITRGAEANGIPAGTVMHADPELFIRPDSIATLSTVQGGKQPPQSMSREHAHKRALSEHGLLITNEDIHHFCLNKFTDFVEDVRVRPGIMESGDPRKGFIPTIDVSMTLRKEMAKYVQDGTAFEQELKNHSPETYRYRVIVIEH